MIRQRCNAQTVSGSRCKSKFRARIYHEFCRRCHSQFNGESRPLTSRELSENKYRRTKKRRKFIPVTKKTETKNAKRK